MYVYTRVHVCARRWNKISPVRCRNGHYFSHYCTHLISYNNMHACDESLECDTRLLSAKNPQSDNQEEREKDTVGQRHTIAGGEEAFWICVGIMFSHNHHRLCGNTGNILVKENNKHCLLGTETVSVLRYVLICAMCLKHMHRTQGSTDYFIIGSFLIYLFCF